MSLWYEILTPKYWSKLERESRRLDKEYNATILKTDELKSLYEINKIKNASYSDKAILDVKLKYNQISKYDYDIALLDHEVNKKDNNAEYIIRKAYIDFTHDKISQVDYDIAKLIHKHEIQEITSYERDIDIAKLQPNPDRTILDIKRLHHVILEDEYASELASLQQSPFGKITFSYNNGTISCETIFNEYMISVLKKQGHYGTTDQEIIDQWIESVCQSVLSDHNI
jgi:hypothetical protein